MINLNVLALSLLLFLGATDYLIGQTANRPKPPQLPDYQFNSLGVTSAGFYFVTPFSLANGGNTGLGTLMMLDSGGYVYWYTQMPARSINDFKYYPDHHLYTFNKQVGPTTAQYMVMNEAFEVIDSFTNVNGVAPDIHDFLISTDGTYLIGGASDSIFDLSAYIISGIQGSATTHCQGFVVQEFDANHNLIFQWDSNDHIFPTEALPFYGYNANNFDYCHANTIAEDDDKNLLISFRHLNSVYKINRTTGNVMWRLCGKSSSFTFTNADRFSGQHDVRRLPNGNIALFDNANTAPSPKQSRAVEYALDMTNMVATKVWEYQYNPAFFAIAMGSHQTTADRDHIVGYGLVYRPNPSVVRINDAGGVQQELFFKDSVMSYRAYWHNPPVDDITRPVITCTPSNSGVVLTATSGYSDYQWSNGEKTLSINVTQPGEYQVWTNYGIGMLGAIPYTVTDPSKGCTLSSTSSPDDINAAPNMYIDLLGRIIEQPVRGNWYWQKTKQGKWELRMEN